MPPPQRVLMPERHDGKRPPNPIRWACDQGHIHPSRLAAVKCNLKHRSTP